MSTFHALHVIFASLLFHKLCDLLKRNLKRMNIFSQYMNRSRDVKIFCMFSFIVWLTVVAGKIVRVTCNSILYSPYYYVTLCLFGNESALLQKHWYMEWNAIYLSILSSVESLKLCENAEIYGNPFRLPILSQGHEFIYVRNGFEWVETLSHILNSPARRDTRSANGLNHQVWTEPVHYSYTHLLCQVYDEYVMDCFTAPAHQ